MTTQAKPQPKPGDVLLGCLHKPDRDHAHYYLLGGNGMPFARPNRTTAIARWIVLCETCHRTSLQTGKSPAEAPLAFDYTWTDTDEIAYKEPS